MALIHIEGFDALQSGSSLSVDLVNSGQYIGWSVGGGGGPAKLAGQIGGSQWASNGGSNNLSVFNFPSPVTTFIVGCRVNIPIFRLQWLWDYWDSQGGGQLGGNLHIGLAVTAGGKLCVARGGASNSVGTILATGTTQLVFGAYYYMELLCTINSTTGSFTVRLNGVQELTATNVNTQTGGTASVASIIWRWIGAENLLIDDLYISDTTGSAPYNTFLADSVNALRVQTLFPTNCTQAGFTPGTNTTFALYNTSINAGNTFATGTCYYFPIQTGITASITAGGTLTALIVRFQTTFSGNCKFAVYDNTGTANGPGTLLATSNVVTTATGNATFGSAPDITFTFASPPTLAANTGFWIAFLTDSNAILWTRNAVSFNSTQAVTYVSGFPGTAAPTATLQGPGMPYFVGTGSISNALNVMEVDSDNDTTYNLTSAPATDMFQHGSLTLTPVTIYAVQVTPKFRSDDVSNMTARGKLTSGATTVSGTSWTAATVYQYVKDIYINDPNTGVAWASAAAVNNTIIGYERVT